MSTTHLSLHYHLVFSTKNRLPMLADEWRPRVFAYLGGSLKTIGGIPEAVGGTHDHVHILAGLKATHRLADVVKEIKTASTRWIKAEFGVSKFAWQTGYGAFTVSASMCERVREYIENQPLHHKTRTFESEYVELLQLSQIDYEEKFLW